MKPDYPFGPMPLGDGRVRFRLWAPAARQVELALESNFLPMQPKADGWYELDHIADAGTLYRFRIDGDLLVPDPASHFQPDDVLGPSQVVAHDYHWRTPWQGRPWQEAVVYELHIGAFSALGNYLGALGRLNHLVDLGVTAIELMPLADFAGRRNWGYDGVLPFAPDSAYGQPQQLKQFIDAAHRRGLMVLLDVVYNHFGPEGNFLPSYAPDFFSNQHHTPWGAGIDYRNEMVRAFAVQNVRHWLEHYRFDGLRLDAVHAIAARGEPSILDAIRGAAEALAEREQRHIHLVLENDDNTSDLLSDGKHAGYRAQWNDDYHHAWHVLLTGENHGYYSDYPQPYDMLKRALVEGFVYQGGVSQHRGGARRGQDSTGLPPTAFVNFLQNHDQIGNRPFGERLESLASRRGIEAAIAVTLLAPQIPMLFMGEEWGSTQPFPFFCDFQGPLAKAVREGRRREFAAHYALQGGSAEPPDALATETFKAARLRWQDVDEHGDRLDLVRRLLKLRQLYVVPHLAGKVEASALPADQPVLQVQWRFVDGYALGLRANLSPEPVTVQGPAPVGERIWGEQTADVLPGWHVEWLLAPP